MKDSHHFSLLAKVLGWLLLHLLALALAVFVFIASQLGFGLDSLLSGAAGDRLEAFANDVRARILPLPRQEWNEAILPLAKNKGVVAAMLDPHRYAEFPSKIPPNVLERVRKELPPPPSRPPERRGFGDPPPPPGGPDERRPSPGPVMNISPDPVFLMRGDAGDGYWAGVRIILTPDGRPQRPNLLLLRSDRLDGSGMFFEWKPWLWGGLAVLLLSVAFWTPFVLRITRYIRRLTQETGKIAAGNFQLNIPPRGNDELGNLGSAIETMAGRLDHLIAGQKRFLGDAAHELCAPLARLRTGLSIIEMQNGPSDRLSAIEEEAQELAVLVEEILEFSRVGKNSPTLRDLALKPLLDQVIAKEGHGLQIHLQCPEPLLVKADPVLLTRAIGNLLRNVTAHVGENARVVIHVQALNFEVTLSLTDDGPGLPAGEFTKIFAPFYRPDLSRSRDTGGSGLGLAIARTSIEACGGSIEASPAHPTGLKITITLIQATQ